jgi:zinc-finger of transposase IS204/IS1001/IS1096/IS1165
LVRGSGGEDLTVYYTVMSHTLQALQPFVGHLLPPTRAGRLTEVTMASAKGCLQLTTTAAAADCPRCAVPSSSVHSRYRRHLTDLPWGARPVSIRLTVRKFVCRNARVWPSLIPFPQMRMKSIITAVGCGQAHDDTSCRPRGDHLSAHGKSAHTSGGRIQHHPHADKSRTCPSPTSERHEPESASGATGDNAHIRSDISS